MDIWIIQDGEKIGPIHDFEVRRKIENGELPAATPAWHEGIAAWKPLVEIDLFAREFDKPISRVDEPYDPPEQATPPLLPSDPQLIRRFWARWFDLSFFSSIWWIAMWLSGRDIGMIINQPWIMLFHYVPWFVIEAFLIHRFGSTLGKWLLGIRVVNDDGSLLDLAQSTRRAARVFFIGIGFGWLVLALVCQFLSWVTTKRLGRPLWDRAGGHRLAATPLHPIRLVGYVFVFFVAIVIQGLVVVPPIFEAKKRTDPEFKAQWEKFQEEMHRGSDTPVGKP